MTPDTLYRLPNHPSHRVLDRFSLIEDPQVEDEDGTVPLWLLLQTILATPVASVPQLIEALDTIANSVRGSSGVAGDYGSLRSMVECQRDFFPVLWPRVVRHALDLPVLFPEASVEPLRPGSTINLSDKQAACLLAHQFLCTLSAPPWREDYFDFSIWYGSGQRHPEAVRMYMSSVFEYFRSAGPSNAERDGVEYALHECHLDTSKTWDAPLSNFHIEIVDDYTTETQLLSAQGPDGATVVSANKYIGFGQSATQEEIFVGNAPESCPAVLFTPVLGDDMVLVVRGAQSMLQIRGQRRDISWRTLPRNRREGGRMLFMDALEMDEAEADKGLPDLLEHNVQREVRKAYAAFASWQVTEAARGKGRIWTGLWGCGAFNGDPGVKMVIMWIAASMAGKDLVLTVDASHGGDVAQRLERFVRRVGRDASVSTLRRLLEEVPKHTQRLEALGWLLEATKPGATLR